LGQIGEECGGDETSRSDANNRIGVYSAEAKIPETLDVVDVDI
jgi:hypothetical protein